MDRTDIRAHVLVLLIFCPMLHAEERSHLTPAQQRVLALPPTPPIEQPFRFNNPPGPRFSEEQKRSQREAGTRIVPLVLAAYAKGADSVRIRPGDYRFGAEAWGKGGPVYPLELNGLKRDADRPFLIDATGATFWFDLPDDQAQKAHFCMALNDCENIVLKGATLERASAGSIEGRIVRVDFENNRFEIELSPGIVLPKQFNGALNQRIVPFKSDGRFCAPLYALQSGGVHLRYSIIPGEGNRCFVTMADRALMDTIRNPAWIAACGDLGVLKAGDGIHCIYTTASSLALNNCRNVTIQDLRDYVTKGCKHENGGWGGNLWKNCYSGPRPGTCRWQGGDGFMFNGTRFGTTLDNFTIIHTTDDAVNFHGYWAAPTSITGNRLIFPKNKEIGGRRGVVLEKGDRILFVDSNNGGNLGEALILSVEAGAVDADQDVGRHNGALVLWPDHQCADWLIQNCQWRDNYQRLLIQAGPGTVRNCVLERMGSSIKIVNDIGKKPIEGGVLRDITIAGNRLVDMAPFPGGAAIDTRLAAYGKPGAMRVNNLSVIGNTIVRPGLPAIIIENAVGGVFAENKFEQIMARPPLTPTANREPRAAIVFKRSSGVDVRGNSLNDPGGCAAPDPLTKSPILGIGEECGAIALDGREIAPAKEDAKGARQ